MYVRLRRSLEVAKSVCSISCESHLRKIKQIPTSRKYNMRSISTNIWQFNEKRDEFTASIGNYDIFRDSDARVILDVDEERKLLADNPDLVLDEGEEIDEFQGMNLEHGISGVFDVEELVDVLRNDKARDIFVVSVPPECKYVDHMVIVSGKSYKHMLSIAEFIKKLFKRKRYEHDHIPKIEGKLSNDWIAMDLGNIALHIMSEEARNMYNLECLWTVGPEYDSHINKKEDTLVELLQQHTFLANIQPLQVEHEKK